MENDGRMGLRCIVAPEQAEHAALKEYATIRLMQVMAERDAAIVERDNALAEKKSALTERDSAYIQRDIAVAERDAAIIERENAIAALEAARGHHRALGWNQYKRQPEHIKGRDAATMLQMSLPNVPFGVDETHPFGNESSMLGFINNSGKLHPIQQPQQQHHHQQHPHHHHQQQQQQQHQQRQQHQQQQQQQPQPQPQPQPRSQPQPQPQPRSQPQPQPQTQTQTQTQSQPQPQPQQQQQHQEQPNGKSRKKETPKTKRDRKTTGNDVSKLDLKKKRDENGARMQENVMTPLILPVAPYHGQEIAQVPAQKNEMHLDMEEMKEVEYVINTPIPHCSCTGTFQPCYRWGNGGWQSACCTTTLSEHPLPMNPLKKGYRLPGRKMSAGAFQKLVRRLAQEGVDLSQPIDLKDFWAKHGTNRYVTIK